MSSQNKALIALLIASFFWATSGVVTKVLLKTFDPLSLGVIRLTIASIVILPFFLRSTKKVTKKLILDILPVSIFSTANFVFFLFGINTTTANSTGIIYTATPLLTALLSRKLIGEHVSRQKITGILIGLLGVLTILFLPLLEKNHIIVGDIRGNLLIVCAMIMFSLYNIGSRHLTNTKQYDPLIITSISLFVSALVFHLLYVFLPHKSIFPAILVPTIFLCAVYFAVFVTVLTYILHQWAIKHSSATTGALTTYIQPVLGFVLNGFFLGEVITGGFMFGSILVFAGTLMATGTRMIDEVKKILSRLH